MRVLRGNVLKIGVSMTALICATAATMTAAQAGAFAVREQSAYYQGMSFAGSAAGDELSSMFWNSAAAAAAPGMNTESHVALVVPDTEITATGGDFLNAGFGAESGDIGDPTLVPASYANYQVNERLFLGIATNAQYGFTTKPDNLNFAGTPIATTSEVFSININPNVAYKISPNLTVGVGAQILYADVRLRTSDPSGALATPGRTTEVDDWAFGATAGVSWTPAPGTTIGVGYRSRIEVEAEGTCSGLGISNAAAGLQGGNQLGCLTGADVSADLTLPDLVTASIRQQINDRVTLLGTVEWTNWSLVGDQAEFVDGNGDLVDVFPLGYDDGWFFAVGLEYAYTPHTTLRGGIAYEISPISDEERNVSLPDADRIWLSIGATTQLTEKISIDLAYTHIFVDDAPIVTEGGTGSGILFEGEGDGDVDIIAASFKYNWGHAEPELEPYK